MELVIVRGLPGAGKSTFAKKYAAAHGLPMVVQEADMYMVDADGNYKFDPKKLHYCHKRCKEETMKNIGDYWFAVVANTFTTFKEIQAYCEAFERVRSLVSYHRLVRIIDIKTQFESIHGVPEEKMKQMADRWWETNLDHLHDAFPNLSFDHRIVE